MHVRDALDRLDQIHNHLSRAEVYHGFRVPAVAAIGLLALGAAAAQPAVPGAAEGAGFVWFWVAVAAAGALTGTAAAAQAYATREDGFARRRTRQMVLQFLPCVLTGAAVTAAVARAPDLVGLLPGVWAATFGLGLLAASPHLPRGIRRVSLGYVAAGAALAVRWVPGAPPNGWEVGTVFGAGHLACSFALWRGADRNEGAGDE
ncbi:hypothetical protein [Gemmata sp.]|uniref:hypothetical protein n=1 Tax=Gemmata sp. TaxID=1914242 RepID=UPI003F718C6A